MQEALAEAKAAGLRGEIPVGAILVDSASGRIIARSGNRTEADHDPTAHAEMIVMREGARQLGAPRMPEYDLYVTLEPCPMCAAAMSQARIRRLYFGAYDPKSGGVDHGPRIFTHAASHHKPEVYGGLNEQTCGDLLRDFFKERR